MFDRAACNFILFFMNMCTLCFEAIAKIIDENLIFFDGFVTHWIWLEFKVLGTVMFHSGASTDGLEQDGHAVSVRTVREEETHFSFHLLFSRLNVLDIK
jgi:hypothetical protein